MADGATDALRAIRESANRHAVKEAEAVQHLLAVKTERERDLAQQYLALHKLTVSAPAAAAGAPASVAAPNAAAAPPRSPPHTARGPVRVQLPPDLQAVYDRWQQQISPAYVQQALAAADAKQPQSARAHAAAPPTTRVVAASGADLEVWPLPPPTVTRQQHQRKTSGAAGATSAAVAAAGQKHGAANGANSNGSSTARRPASAATDKRSARATASSVIAPAAPAAAVTRAAAAAPAAALPTKKAPLPQRPASASATRPTAKSMSAAAVTSARALDGHNGLVSAAEVERMLAPTGIGYQSPRRKAATDSSAPATRSPTMAARALSPAPAARAAPLTSPTTGTAAATPSRSGGSSGGAGGLTVAVSPGGRRAVSLLPRAATDSGAHKHYVSPWRQKKLDEKARRDAVRTQRAADVAARGEQERAYAAAMAERAARELDAVADAVRASMARAAAQDRERAAAEARAQAERDRVEARAAFLRQHQSQYGLFVADQTDQPPLLLYKMCAIWGNRFVDIFDGKTEFTLGASQHIPRDDGDEVERFHSASFPCYVFATPELAVAERFPRAANAPAAAFALRGEDTERAQGDARDAAHAAADGPGASALLNTPRALLKVVVIGDARDYGGGKYAFAHMKAVEVVLWSSGSRLTTVRDDSGRVIGRERLYDWVSAADSYRPPPLSADSGSGSGSGSGRAAANGGKRSGKKSGETGAAAAPVVSVAAEQLMYVLLQRPALWREFVALHPALFPKAGGKYDASTQRVVPQPLVRAFEQFVRQHQQQPQQSQQSAAARRASSPQRPASASSASRAAPASTSSAHSAVVHNAVTPPRIASPRSASAAASAH